MMAALIKNSGTAAINFDDVWTPLLISTGLIAMGALMAFDIGGYASTSARSNSGFTPWGRSYRGSDWLPAWLPPLYKVIGWIFLLFGVPIFALSAAVLILRGLRKALGSYPADHREPRLARQALPTPGPEDRIGGPGRGLPAGARVPGADSSG